MHIDLYLDKNLTFIELKKLIESSGLSFITEITVKNDHLYINANNFLVTVESKSCTSQYSIGFLQYDEEFIHSELIENFAIKPLTTIFMYCSNDGTGFDDFCALIGYLQKFIKANYIAFLEDVGCEDFAQKDDIIIMRDDYIDNSCIALYQRLLQGDFV